MWKPALKATALRHPLITIFSIAFAIRGVVAVLLTKYFSGSLVLDDQTYWTVARDVAYGLTAYWDDYLSGLYAQTRTFSLPLAAVYLFFGGNELAGQLLVAASGAALAVVVYVIAREMLGPRLAFVPAAIIVILPSSVLWSSLVLKDAFVWLALALVALVVTKLTNATEPRHLGIWLVTLAVSVLALRYLRTHTTVVACWALLFACWVGPALGRLPRLIGIALVAVTIPWFTGLGPAGISFALAPVSVTDIREANAQGAQSAIISPRVTPGLDEHRKAADDLASRESALKKQLEEARAGSQDEALQSGEVRDRATRLQAQLQGVQNLLATEQRAIDEIGPLPSDPTREIGVRYVARGVSVMLLEPYPWDPSTSASFRMAKIEGLIWYPVVALALIGLLRVYRYLRVMLFPLLVGLGTMFLYALTEGNIGTAFRHRGEFVWVVALLAGLGTSLLLEKRSHAVRVDPST